MYYNLLQNVGTSGPAEVPKPLIGQRMTIIGMHVITRSSIGKRITVMSVCVCVYVCLSVRDHIFGTTRPIFTKFLCMLSMAVARSFCYGVVIRYVLPVLWMTSYLLISQGCSTSPPS